MKKQIDYYDEVFTLNDLACFLKVSNKTAREMLKNGKIKGNKIGREWRIHKSSVVEYLEVS